MRLISCMNRIDWVGNPGPTIRRGEVFEMNDPEIIKTWVDAGYVLVVEEQDVGAESAPTSKNNVDGVNRWDGQKWDNLKDTTVDVPVPKKKGRKKRKVV